MHIRIPISEGELTSLVAHDLELKSAVSKLLRGNLKKISMGSGASSCDDDPARLFVTALFSRSSENIASFEKRHIDTLFDLANRGYVPSIYALAVYFDTGELLRLDPAEADRLFEIASGLGHPRSSFLVGLMYYYGTKGKNLDREKGVDLISKSASKGEIEAINFLKKEGLKNPQEAAPENL